MPCLEEQKKIIAYYKKDFGYDIKLIEPPYDNDSFNEFLKPFSHLGEGTERCFNCYEKRMNEAFKFANDNGYDYFVSIMSISRFKNAQKMNEIGEKLSKIYPNTKYFFSDFKKKGGEQQRGILTRKYGLYDQNYCGCIFSLNEMKERTKNV